MEERYAFLSVSDKTGLVEFAGALQWIGIGLISTGGTAEVLREAGFRVEEVSDYTGFPEILDGRVKSLHPKVHGGILYIRGNRAHEATAFSHNIKRIDFVVVNFYPFEEMVKLKVITPAEIIEHIDIGGPGMVRSAAKNHEAVTVVTDPTDYDSIFASIRENGGDTTLAQRKYLACKAFAATTAYDVAITKWFVEYSQTVLSGSR